MRNFRRSMIFVLCASTLGSGCGKTPPQAVDPDRGSHWVATGDLSSKVEELSRADYASECDAAFLQMKIELASAVDQHQTDVEKALESDQRIAPDLIPFHNSFLVATHSTLTQTGWQEDRKSWQSWYRYYKANLKKPPAMFWVYLNRGVRGLLADDYNRVHGKNMGIGKDDVDLLPGLNESIQICMNDKNCLEPKFTAEQKLMVERVPLFRWKVEDLQDEKDDSKKRDVIERLAKQVEYDLQSYSFKVNESIKTTQSATHLQLELPLIAEGFSAEDRKLIADYSEKKWKDEKHSLKIKFLDRNGTPNPFKLFFDSAPGSRAYVTKFDKEVHLAAYMDDTGIAHEIGHVLGFIDSYRTVWDGNQCIYTIQSRQDDLMSDHDTGSVTADQWKKIDLYYGNQK